MDRSLNGGLPPAVPVAGYELIDRRGTARGGWEKTHNLCFADHWRFAPRSEEELLAGKSPELCLMAVTSAGGTPAALTICHIETFAGDARAQPVGLVSSVGTVPGHRRRGLARWLVAAGLLRLQAAGARVASLYVDGWNETRAHEAYGNLGFHLAFEADVWETAL
jgi:mycothiol synthase